jgi:soluble lytic murein transglycosylase-like protein
MKSSILSRHKPAPALLRPNPLLRSAAVALLCCGLLTMSHAAPSRGVDEALKARLQNAIADTSSFDDQYDATVWLTDMALRLERRVEDPDERLKILQFVHQEAQRVDLAPELVLAVIDIESAFDHFAVSSAGARGLMQVMPFWLDELEQPQGTNLFDIPTNLRMGCTILRYYIDMENGDLTRALARYNGSTGKTWYSERVLGRLSARWFQL